MGTWGAGLFDNDTALDFLEVVGSMTPAGRLEHVVQTLRLSEGIGRSATPPVTIEEAIAAASIVAANMPGGEEFPWHDEVQKISDWLPKPVSNEVAASAVRALDAATPADGWWWRSWVDSTEKAQMKAMLEVVRGLLLKRGSYREAERNTSADS